MDANGVVSFAENFVFKWQKEEAFNNGGSADRNGSLGLSSDFAQDEDHTINGDSLDHPRIPGWFSEHCPQWPGGLLQTRLVTVSSLVFNLLKKICIS